MIKLSFAFIFFVGFLNSFLIAEPPVHLYDKLDNMPILEARPAGFAGMVPTPERGIEFRKFLAASLKIQVSGASGSGTIVYYDDIKNIAYVASCGHLWNQGLMSAEEGKKRKMKCKVVSWYHNDVKLDSPKIYDADVLFYSHIRSQDTALISFKPDWKPNYFPIADLNYEYKINGLLNSLGCDAGSEVARYEVTVIDNNVVDLVTKNNSPRPGRSGGGLMDDNGYYVGTCWGTQYIDGTGKGFFTPLSAIHSYWGKQSEYSFLLKQNLGLARKITIKDRIEQQETYSKEYILMPIF